MATADTKIELILFYADWCSHCIPIVGSPDKPWDQLEAMYANHPRIRIRKISDDELENYMTEATVYEKPTIHGFPTVMRIEGLDCQVAGSALKRSLPGFQEFLEEPDQVILREFDQVRLESLIKSENTCVIL